MNHNTLVEALGDIGFSVTKEDVNSTRLEGRSGALTLFVQKSKGRRDNKVSKRLVIHPRYADRLDAIARIPGVVLKASATRGQESPYTHSTTLSPFPRRLHKGKKEICHGIALHVPSPDALPAIINVLMRGTGRGNNAPGVLPQKTRPPSPGATSPDTTLAADLARADADLRGLDSTTREALINARVGQGLFRRRLVDYWNACAITGIHDTRLLRASHIKPWRDCDNDERLYPFNGLLLTPAYDHCFDIGLIGFDDAGRILVRDGKSNASTLEFLGIRTDARLSRLDARHLPYLRQHRAWFDL